MTFSKTTWTCVSVVIIYLDDILIFSAAIESHRQHIKCVLGRLRQHGLYAKPEKCEFEQQSIQFFGLIISVEGVKMDPQKISAILEWPAPADKKGIQRFIGFANFYRKFIKGFSAITYYSVDQTGSSVPLDLRSSICL